jgi:hypothetical protein
VNRPRQVNCHQEPPYPGLVTCIISLRAPALTAHNATILCPIECPHSIELCGEWQAR